MCAVVQLLSLGATAFSGSGDFDGSFGPADMAPQYAPMNDLYTLQSIICGGQISLQGKGMLQRVCALPG